MVTQLILWVIKHKLWKRYIDCNGVISFPRNCSLDDYFPIWKLTEEIISKYSNYIHAFTQYDMYVYEHIEAWKNPNYLAEEMIKYVLLQCFLRFVSNSKSNPSLSQGNGLVQKWWQIDAWNKYWYNWHIYACLSLYESTKHKFLTQCPTWTTSRPTGNNLFFLFAGDVM